MRHLFFFILTVFLVTLAIYGDLSVEDTALAYVGAFFSTLLTLCPD